MPEIVTPLAPIPVLPLCVCIPQPSSNICITLPVVGEVCSTRSTFNYQPLSGLLLQFVGNLQPLLAPLMPVLVLISLVIALVDCVKSVPKAISQLSPGPVLDCIDHLLEILPQLLQFVPPLNYISLMRNVIFFLISLVQAIIDELNNLLAINVDVDLGLLPNDQYRCCLDANIQARLNQFITAIQPTGPLFRVVAEILRILALPGIDKYIQPLIDMADFLANTSEASIAPDLVNGLRDIQNTLVAIHTILGGILGEVQTLVECEC